MPSQLAARLSRLESATTPEAKMCTVFQTVICGPGDKSEVLPISASEMQRVRADGFRDGVDILVVVRNFVEAEAT